jgi:hypothetical protein
MTQARPIPPESERAASLVAVKVLVLWPSEPAGNAASWPLFVLVVDEEADPVGTAWLSAHLDGDRAGEPAVTSHCQWSVTVSGEASLGLSVRACEPVDLDLEVLVAAECFLGLFDVAARGAAVALATRRHARRLDARAATSQALDDVLLLGCRTSAKLAGLADVLCDTRTAEGNSP